MKKLTVMAILLIGLGAQASSFFGGDIPTGDKLRTTGVVSTRTATDTTLLTLVSQGGVMHAVILGASGGAGSDAILNSIKVTVDGASERTLSYGIYTTIEDTSVGHNPAIVIPVPISFNTSLTVKVNAGYSSGSNGTALGVYSKK